MSAPKELPLPVAMARVMRAADRNWSRSRPLVPTTAVQLERWGSLAIRNGAARATFFHALPRVEVAEEETARRLFRAASQQVGQPLVGSLGRRLLTADRVHLFGRYSVGDGTREATATGYQLIDWVIAHPDRRPAVFVGTVADFEHVIGWANVRLPPVFGLGHTYVPSLRADVPDVGIVCATRGRDGIRLALRWADAEPATDRRWLTRVVAAVSFVLGVPVQVPLFIGFDDRGRRVAARGSLFGVRREFGSLPGQPISVSGAAWIVPFLRRLLVLLRDRPDVAELDLALQYYVDSYDDPLDAAYLKLVVVLEGLAQRVLQERGASVGVTLRGKKLSVVQDATWWEAFTARLGQSDEFARWRAHVESERPTLIGALVRNPTQKDWGSAVIDKLATRRLSDADELSAGQRVLAALLALGANPDRDMKRECREWHGARHTGVAPGDPDGVEDRLALVRSMLVLLISRWAGYGGPIIGHVRERDANGRAGGVRDLRRTIVGEEVDEGQRAEGLIRYVGREE